jgi:hypothetical protein
MRPRPKRAKTGICSRPSSAFISQQQSRIATNVKPDPKTAEEKGKKTRQCKGVGNFREREIVLRRRQEL